MWIVVHVISSICTNGITTRSRWKFTICTTTNDLTLYSFSSLHIFVSWGWPTVTETCRQPNKTDTKTVVFWRTYPRPNWYRKGNYARCTVRQTLCCHGEHVGCSAEESRTNSLRIDSKSAHTVRRLRKVSHTDYRELLWIRFVHYN
jgi:hypothetical protein